MSFHPLMVYDPKRFQQSERRLVEEGAPFTFTPERRAALDILLTKYPADRKRSAVLAALYCWAMRVLCRISSTRTR